MDEPLLTIGAFASAVLGTAMAAARVVRRAPTPAGDATSMA